MHIKTANSFYSVIAHRDKKRGQMVIEKKDVPSAGSKANRNLKQYLPLRDEGISYQ